MTAPLPLEGLRILAFTHVAAGPYGTLQLAYLGAEIIKVESTTRMDTWRFRDRNRDPELSRTFADHNKNTRSVTLDLKTPAGVDLARRLAATCDVVIDNFSAGVLDRLGIGYDDLRPLREDIIVIHLSGMTSEGPRRHWVTFGPSIMAMSGMTALWNHPDTPEPVGSQTSYPDYLAGLYGAFACLAAVGRRDATGEGGVYDVSQLAIMAAALGPLYVAAADGREPPIAHGNASPDAAPHGCYPCRGDDRWCVISVPDDTAWDALRAAMGDPPELRDQRFASAPARIAAAGELDAAIEAWTRPQTAEAVVERCVAVGVPAGIVMTGEDLSSDPHLLARGFLLDIDHPRLGRVRLPGAPVRIGEAPLPVWRAGPLLGEDTAAVLAEHLDIDEAGYAELVGLEAIR